MESPSQKSKADGESVDPSGEASSDAAKETDVKPASDAPQQASNKEAPAAESSDKIETSTSSATTESERDPTIAPPANRVNEEDDRIPKDTDLADENQDWDHDEFHEWHGHREEDEWSEYHHDEDHHDDPHHYEYDEDANSGVDSYSARKEGTAAASTAALATTASSGGGGGNDDSGDTEDDEDDEFGGPIKTFLEHLEDLRWTIIKSVAALLLGMIVCLGGANQLTDLLTRPLAAAAASAKKQAEKQNAAIAEGSVPILRLQWDTNEIDIAWPEGELQGLKIEPGQALPVEVKPIPMGTNVLMALQPAGVIQSSQKKLPTPKLVVLGGPIGAFMVGLKVAFFGGILLAAPFILFFIGQFVVPALKPLEKKLLRIGLTVGGFLFMAGAAFAYFLIAKITINASVIFANWLGFSAEMWNVGDYVGFVCKLIVGVGLGFELPVVLLTLVKIGLLDYKKLVTLRPYFAVAILVMSAMLTPPDIISQVLMSVPMFLLYEVSVWIARFWYKRDEAAAAAAA